MGWVFAYTVICLFLPLASSAEDIDIEKLFDGEREMDEQSAVIEYLEYLSQNPLNVNTASVQELTSLPWISPTVAVRLVKYRHDFGEFRQLDDIQHVRGVKKIYEKISPFLTAGKSSVLPSIHAQGRHRILSRVENSEAFQEHIYAGSKAKILHRVKGSMTDNVKFGLLTEKDAGEKQWNDLTISHLAVNMPRLSSQILAGHFAMQCGQGLVFSGPYRLLKGSDPIASAKQRSRGLYSYLSSAENSAFYGVGISTRLRHFEWHAFSSLAKKDARIENGFVISQPETGLHRTASEQQTKDKLVERVSGFSVESQLQSVRIGIMWQRSFYNHAFLGDDYGKFFQGSINQVVGLNVDYTIKTANIFAEGARSLSGGKAVLAGLWLDLSPLELVLLYRHYDENFENFYAQAFGERSDTRNENGLYFGLRSRLDDRNTISFYCDQWRSPWPLTFVPMPSSGYEIFGSIDHKLSTLVTLCMQYRMEKKDAGVSATDQFGNTIRVVSRPQRSKIRLQMDYRLHQKIELRSRFEITAFDAHNRDVGSDEFGTMLYQDIRWRPNRYFSLQTRWTVFDASSYDVRFYQFENDLPGVMRLKLLNGRGTRWYILCAFTVQKYLKFCVKYENFYADDRYTLGSGHDVIMGPDEHVISCQFDWQF